jgi:PPIC-type PPIASE domain
MTDISQSELFHQLKISGKIPEMIHGILQQRVLEQAAKELRIDISDGELQEGADRFRVANKLESTNATERWLHDRMLSMDDFEQLVTTNLLTYKVADRLFSEQVAPYFHQNILNYAAAVIYEVVVSVGDGALSLSKGASPEENRNLAIELFYAIQEGDMSFADVAKRYGQDAETQRKGGYLGSVPRQKMLPEVSAAVFAAKPPQIIEPILSAKGVYLIWVEEIVNPTLDESLREQIRWQLFQDWLQQKITSLRSNMKIMP